MWDVSDADPTWARLQIEYEPDPATADQFRPLFQLQYFSMTNNVWLNQRLWDYGTAYDWQYSVELFDKNGARYARNYKWDDDTWRYYDYDHNGKDWTRIKEYVLADKTTVSQKEGLYDDGHFVIQRWDVDGSKPWRRYYVRKEDENPSTTAGNGISTTTARRTMSSAMRPARSKIPQHRQIPIPMPDCRLSTMRVHRSFRLP